MTTQQRLAEVFVELADTLVDDFDVVDLLQTLADRTVELLDADASGLMLADQRGDLKLMASTLERARLVELFELQVAEGPCRECFTNGLPITNVDLTEAMERWPRFTPVAVEAGFRATHALPMRLRGQIIGALNIFTEKPAHLGEDDIAVGQAMADVATIALLNERTHFEQVRLSEQLQTALQSRILIEQAKGVLSARANIGVDEAFNRMRHHARGNGLTLSVVASRVIDTTLDLRAVGRV
jgi:transcriptional regulator with GAF, ATPase, and Fis domain